MGDTDLSGIEYENSESATIDMTRFDVTPPSVKSASDDNLPTSPTLKTVASCKVADKIGEATASDAKSIAVQAAIMRREVLIAILHSLFPQRFQLSRSL